MHDRVQLQSMRMDSANNGLNFQSRMRTLKAPAASAMPLTVEHVFQ